MTRPIQVLKWGLEYGLGAGSGECLSHFHALYTCLGWRQARVGSGGGARGDMIWGGMKGGDA